MNDPRYLWFRRSAVTALVTVLAGWTAAVHAQNAGATDAGKLLEQLKALEESVTKARTGNNLAAVTAISEAVAADAKAVALWMESVRETEFRDKDKKESEFRAWRDGAGRRISEPGAAAALRLHLQYLLLTIRVSTATTDAERNEILTPLLAYLDDLSRASKETLRNRQALDTSVLNTPIAKRFKLDVTVRPPEAWSLVPGDLGGIYENSILPYLREHKDVARLQTAWTRRLQQEAAQVATQNSEVATKEFREEKMPALEWGQARDLYIAGSQPAAAKMLQIIQQNQAHKTVPQWISELRSLLTGGPPATTTGSAVAVDDAPGTTTPPELPESEPPAASVPPAAPSAAPPRPGGPPPSFPPNLNR